MLSLSLILGILIILFVMFDVLVTALTVGGGGPLTSRVSIKLWQMALQIYRWRSNHQLLVFAGWLILVFTAVLWFVLIFVGWVLIFNAADLSVVNATSKQSATFWERVYFVGYTLSTLGIGDYQPQGVAWQIATVAASANGFMMISLTISYLLPVVAAATQKRQLAVYISALGGTPDEIITRAWNGKDFGQFDQHLISLAPQIALQGEQNLTYPILHYFHSAERSKASVLSFVVLDEGLTLLIYGVKRSAQPDQLAIKALRRVNAAFLRTLSSVYIEPAPKTPPPPPLHLLRAQGIPTVSDEEFGEAIQHLQERRQLLLRLVQEDGWTWDSVASSQTTNRANELDDSSTKAHSVRSGPDNNSREQH